jgi:hypothetical protein
VLKLIVMVGALILLTSRTAIADVIELTNGQRVEGSLSQVLDGKVTIEIGGQAITFEQQKVRAIYFGSSAPTTTQTPSLAREAIQALKAVQSITTSGVNYQQYAPRVLDAKIVTDRYLQSPESGDQDTRTAVAGAMRFYEFVARAWNVYVAHGDYASVGNDRTLVDCPAADRVMSLSGRADPIEKGIRMHNAFPALWSCASAKIVEAESNIGRR